MISGANARGFTLIEVLAASVVVSLLLGGTYQLFARTLQQDAHNTALQRAMALSHSAAETFRLIHALQPDLGGRCASGDTDACAAADRLANALAGHQSEARRQLPEGTLTITQGGDGRIRITTRWASAVPLQPGIHRLEVLP